MEHHPGKTEFELRNAVRAAERDRQQLELELLHVRRHVDRTQPILRKMRVLLVRVQQSKFWRVRNAWFALKQRLGIDRTGPEPFYVPDIEEVDGTALLERPYERWMYANRIRPGDVRRMRDMLAVLPLRPRFSVVMPVFDPPVHLLREALDSVLAQVYPDWELCIADDASRDPAVRAVLAEYSGRDARIKVAYREENGHISAASNTALALAGGEFVALLDHDDALAPDALFEMALAVNRDPAADVIYSDEDKIDEQGRRSDPHFKPDWAPDSLLARNYVSHLGVFRRSLVHEAGGFREGFEGSQDYDLLLRVTERSDRVVHVPRVLYHWRAHAGSAGAARGRKSYAEEAAVRALEEALVRRGEPGRVVTSDVPGIYTVRYAILRRERVSIIVPTRDHGDDVDRCLRSLFERTTYENFEVILLDNGTTEPASLQRFEDWRAREPARLKIVRYDVPFNFSRINNYAAKHASGPYLLLLNNDTEIVTPDWIEAMIEQAQRPAIGAVGGKLLYDDGTVQHAGVIVGLGGVAGHSHKHVRAADAGYMYTLQTVNNFSAVTGACLMVRHEVFDEAGGFDEAFAIAFNDVDFCLRLRAAGYRNVYLPHVVLYHHESKSRGVEDTPEKRARFLAEQQLMHERWGTNRVPDPYYNVNLTLATEDYAIGV
jgi:O-antigen biosynthesis protein